jgi:hypothetical protein
MAMDPSPTAEATRLRLPERTSPIVRVRPRVLSRASCLGVSLGKSCSSLEVAEGLAGIFASVIATSRDGECVESIPYLATRRSRTFPRSLRPRLAFECYC